MAALEHNKTYSLTDDSKVYHPIKLGEDYPGCGPKGDEMPSDNDQRFCYYTNVRVWKTSQVPEERTHRVASDKVRLWLDAVQNTNPNIQAQIKQLLLRNHLEKGQGRDNLLYLLSQIQPRPSKQGQGLTKRTRRLVKGREGYLPFPSKHWQLLQRYWRPRSLRCIPV